METSPETKEADKTKIITARNPKCSRCRNHGFDAKMKGHKGFCSYVMCRCVKCILVEERRRISRQQILLRRHPNISMKDIIKNAMRCDNSIQQGGDISNIVTDDTMIASSSGYPHLRQINGNQPVHAVSWPLNYQFAPSQPAPGYIYPSAQPDFNCYYSPTASISSTNSPGTTATTMSEVHNCNNNNNNNSGGNLYYQSKIPTANLTATDFPATYAYSTGNYQLKPTPQSFGFRGFNANTNPAHSLFWNSINYSPNARSQRLPDCLPAIDSIKQSHSPENLSFKSTNSSSGEPSDLINDTVK